MSGKRDLSAYARPTNRIVEHEVQDDFQNYLSASIEIWNWSFCGGWDSDGPYLMAFDTTKDPEGDRHA